MEIKPFILAGAVAFGLSACGDTEVERAVTGAAIGGATSEVLGGDAAWGALLGAGVGVISDDIIDATRR